MLGHCLFRNWCRQEWDDLFERSYQQQMWHKATSEKRVDQNQNRLMLVQRHDTEALNPT